MRRLNVREYDSTSDTFTKTVAVRDLIEGHNELLDAILDLKARLDFVFKEIEVLKDSKRDIRNLPLKR
jgi:hypothetical protein